jgi:hypothetical protein
LLLQKIFGIFLREIESQLNVDMSVIESSEIKEEGRTEVK